MKKLVFIIMGLSLIGVSCQTNGKKNGTEQVESAIENKVPKAVVPDSVGYIVRLGDEAPDFEEAEKNADPWFSGELFTYYHDWMFHKNEEFIFDCSSSGIQHKHCMDMLIAKKKKN